MNNLEQITPKTRIAIDARSLSHPQQGGYKTYTRNLVRSLSGINSPHHFTVYVDRPIDDDLLDLGREVTLKVVPSNFPLVGVPFREHVSIPYSLAANHITLAHFPCSTAALLSPCPFIVTIHDTIEFMPISALDEKPPLKRVFMHFYNKENQRRAARHAAATITVSKNSKKDIVQCFGIPEEKVFVTYEAPQDIFSPVKDEVEVNRIRSKIGMDPKFILGIGSADPRKNLTGLILAYSRLPANLLQSYDLVIVLTHKLPHRDASSLADKLGLSNRICFLQGISSEELVLLYNAASLFVFPSLYEGFGLHLWKRWHVAHR